MITSYKKAKEDVLKCYSEFLDIISKTDFPKDDTSLQALKSQAIKIKEDKFCLMIAGEAKSGKSTFINAYLGTEILPMDVRQCTSSVVEIKYGKEFVLHATYVDGRSKTIIGEKDIARFLAENASIDDEYRDIPITIINNEIIVKYKNKSIPKQIILDLLNGVENENIHRLSKEEYNKKIIEYIRKTQPEWEKIVTKIDIEYPFKDNDMRGIRIIDSPGVNAAGRVGDVAAKYIESADAIMFLRPITGVAIEANSFKEFLESKSVDRNKNAMFLILTRAASESENTIERAYEEFVNMFGSQKNDNRHGIVKEQIISVDSKAKLYYNIFKEMSTLEIKNKIESMNSEKKIEPFLGLAWFGSNREKESFLLELKRISNFNAIEQSLNKFGRKAQFIALSEFLGRMLKVYAKINVSLHEKIDNYKLKRKDPNKLALKINEIENELRGIRLAMKGKAKDIESEYSSSVTKGLIAQRAEEVTEQYKKNIEEIDGTSNSAIDQLEKLSFRQVDILIEFEDDLQKKVVSECNEALKVALSDSNTIEYVSLEPDFSKELVDKIKNDMKSKSYELREYTTGATFKETHTKPYFSQDKYYKLVKTSIVGKIDEIKERAISDLRDFVRDTLKAYIEELRKNEYEKMNELHKVEEDKKTADEIIATISKLEKTLSSIEPRKKIISELKGGIDSNV